MDGQAKRPKQAGQLSYTRVTWEGIQLAIVGEDYPGTQISKENYGHPESYQLACG
jgi:hypothetical protein